MKIFDSLLKQAICRTFSLSKIDGLKNVSTRAPLFYNLLHFKGCSYLSIWVFKLPFLFWFFIILFWCLFYAMNTMGSNKGSLLFSINHDVELNITYFVSRYWKIKHSHIQAKEIWIWYHLEEQHQNLGNWLDCVMVWIS